MNLLIHNSAVCILCLDMAFVTNRPSKNKGEFFFLKVTTSA